MDQIKKLFEKTKQSLIITNKNCTDKAIQLIKQVQGRIKVLRQSDSYSKKQLDSLQIICLNNLACVYNKKGKYKASLYHLQLANEIQKQIFKNEQQVNDPQSLHQIATTHSNMCAVLSQMNDHEKAYKQISRAIDLLLKTKQTSESDALVVFYFNCSIQLQYLNKLNDALKIARKGLTLSLKVNVQMEDRFVQLIQKLEQKIKKRQKKVAKMMLNSIKMRNTSGTKQKPLSNRGNSLNLIPKHKSIEQNDEASQLNKQIRPYFNNFQFIYQSKSVKKTEYPSVKLPSFYNNNLSKMDYQKLNNTLRAQQQKNVISIYQPKNRNRMSLRTQKRNMIRKQKSRQRSLQKIVMQDFF